MAYDSNCLLYLTTPILLSFKLIPSPTHYLSPVHIHQLKIGQFRTVDQVGVFRIFVQSPVVVIVHDVVLVRAQFSVFRRKSLVPDETGDLREQGPFFLRLVLHDKVFMRTECRIGLREDPAMAVDEVPEAVMIHPVVHLLKAFVFFSLTLIKNRC